MSGLINCKLINLRDVIIIIISVLNSIPTNHLFLNLTAG